MYRSLLLFFIGMGIFTTPVGGTDPKLARFNVVSIKEGLSQSTVYAITQDARGFMWFGTQDGLNRYDGYQFVVYRHDPQNPDSMADDNILCLLVEEIEGRNIIWIGTEGGGLDRFDVDAGTFRHYRHDPNNPASIPHNWVNGVLRDSSGRLWVATDGGFEPDGG